ncbi:profilin [Streptomyces sp. AB3(2024)]|uniref:profilin n=1 Tax=Streptomyces sp. AB3(2024) TaxID=3317321 RepID=UPI0035A3678F
MSSFQEYVDRDLLGSGAVNQAAIIDQAGSTLAASAGLSISRQEGQALAALFSSPGAASKGIKVAGRTFVSIKADSRSIYGQLRLVP